MDLLEARQPRLFDVDGPLSVASSSSYRSYRSYRSYDSRSSYRSSRRASHDTVRTEADDISTKFEYLEGPISRAASPMLDPENRTSQVSVASCASTVSSRCGQEVEQVTAAEEADFDMPDFHLNDYCTESVPTTPVDFGKLFPSTKKLCITHDDSVLDGNMNLKIITAVRTPKGRMQNMTLFHLRMYDLRKREFSLRRYDRDSGREVAHTVRKYQAPSDGRRPILQRSLSSAFSSFRSRTDSKASGLARVDSHSTSHKSLHTPEPSHTTDRTDSGSQLQPKVPTNTTRLEFSNYAQVEIKRRGTRAGKRYEFEYWGTKYQWRRKVTSQDGQTIQTSFQLVQAGESVALANIVPEPLSPVQQHEEAAMGRWVPPCAMWISDQRLIKHENDVSDVVVASGLMALVDDCIKNRFHDKKQSAVYGTSLFDRLLRPLSIQHDLEHHAGRGTTSRPGTAAPTSPQQQRQQRIAPQLRHTATT